MSAPNIYIEWERDTFKALADMSLDLAYAFLTVPFTGADRAQAQLALLKSLRTGIATRDPELAHLELAAGLPEICPRCHGERVIYLDRLDGDGELDVLRAPCPACTT